MGHALGLPSHLMDGPHGSRMQQAADGSNEAEGLQEPDDNCNDADKARREHASFSCFVGCRKMRRSWRSQQKVFASETGLVQAAFSLMVILRPSAAAIFTRAASEKRSIRPRSRSLIRGCVTPQRRAASV